MNLFQYLKELKMKIYNQFIMEQVIDIVCETMNVDVKDVLSSNRQRNVVDARRIAMNILIREEGLSLTSVSKFVKKNHATGIHHKKVHDVLYATEKAYRCSYDLCMFKYKGGDKSTFADVLDLADKYKELVKTLEEKDKEIADLKYDILKLQNKFRKHNFMIPA